MVNRAPAFSTKAIQIGHSQQAIANCLILVISAKARIQPLQFVKRRIVARFDARRSQVRACVGMTNWGRNERK
jgi:hypothetical protein